MRTRTLLPAIAVALALSGLTALAGPFTLGLSGGLAVQAVCDATGSCPTTNGWTAGVSLGLQPETPNIISGGLLLNAKLVNVNSASEVQATLSPVVVLGPRTLNAYVGPSVGFAFSGSPRLLIGALAGAQFAFGNFGLFAELQVLDDTAQPNVTLAGTGSFGVRLRF